MSYRSFYDIGSLKVDKSLLNKLNLRSKSLFTSDSKNSSNKSVLYSIKMNADPNNGNNNVITEEYPDEIPIEVLVPDPYFGSLLNENGENQVNETIYKVTPYGTYITTPENIDNLDSLIDNGNIPIDIEQLGDNLYRVSNEVLRYDTYNNQNIVDIEDQSIANSQSFTQPIINENLNPSTPANTSNTQYITGAFALTNPNSNDKYTYLDQAIYNGLSSYLFDAQTWVGKTIQNLFGRTKPHFSNFSSSDRVKVNFYSVNYYLFSSIGINVKMQHKGWTGIWRKQDAQELRLGWDGLAFKTKLKSLYPGYPTAGSTFSRVVRHESDNYKFMKIKYFPFNIPTITVLGVKDITEQQILDMVNGVVASTVNAYTKKAFDWAEQQLAPQQVAWRDAQTKQFKMVFPDSFTSIFSRYEEMKVNAEDITNNFDWDTAEIGIGLGGNGQWKFELSEKAIDYEILSGSIYGMAKFNNQWKGVRIIK